MPIQINEITIKASPGAAILSLEQRVALLEQALQVTNEKVTLSCGGSVITLSATGNVTITGRDVTITSAGRMMMKSSGDLTMKGARINQN